MSDMNRLSTPWAAAMGLSAPIPQRSDGWRRRWALAAAVTRSGGLGMIGIGSAGSNALLQRELAYLSDVDSPFGIGLIGWGVRVSPPF